MTATNLKLSGGVLTRFALWLFSWRGARALLITAAWVLTLAALVYAVENWRGNRQWQAVRQDLENRGEELNFRKLLDHNIPPDQNFGATPFVSDGLSTKKSKGDRHTWARDVVPSLRGKGTERRRTDLVAWAQAFKATEAGPARVDLERNPALADNPQARAEAAGIILSAMSAITPSTRDLQAMLDRPHARFPAGQKANPYDVPPYFSIIRNSCQRLELEACAQLAAGDGEAGLQSILVGLNLADSVREEPYFIVQLVRISGMQLMIQPIWEGLVDHRWNQEQLARLDARFSRIDVLRELNLALDAERALGILTIDLVRHHGDVTMLDGSAGARNERFRRAIVKALPDGWFAMEKANFCRNLGALAAGLDLTNRTVSPKLLSEARDRLHQRLTPAQALRTHQLASRLLLPALGSASSRFAVAQAHFDMVRIAVALEQYRLDRNAYPESLPQLSASEKMPRELFPGHPAYRYQPQDKGYSLYSIGWDLDDDLGKHVGRDTTKDGDWVWGHVTL